MSNNAKMGRPKKMSLQKEAVKYHLISHQLNMK